MKRAFIFTMDAIMALVPVFIIVGAVSTMSAGESILLRGHFVGLHYAASDLAAASEKAGYIDDMGEMFTNYTDLKNKSDPLWTIEKERLLNYTNDTLLRLVSENRGFAVEFWGVYENGTSYLDVEYTTDNRTVTGQTERPYENESATTLASVKLATGYEKDVPLVGYTARAWIDKIQSKTTTDVFSFSIQGSGWNTRNVDIEKNFDLPANVNVTNALLYISIHYSDLNVLTVNGVNITDRINWLYVRTAGTYPYYSFGVANVTNLTTAGNNNMTISMEHSGAPDANNPFHAHTHPGMRFEVAYETDQMSQATQTTKRFYFDKTTGRSGAWQMVSFYIPPDAVVNAATLYIHAEHLDDRYRINVNDDNLVYVTGLGSDITYDNNLDILPYIQNGTNVVSTYFDCCYPSSNSEYGTGTVEISNTSYVEIQYTSLPSIPYGYIDFTKVVPFGGIEEEPKEVEFTLLPSQNYLTEAFVHISQIRSYEITVEARADADSYQTVFTSPNPRVTPTDVFIDPQIFAVGKNYVRISDSGSNYWILPESSIEYTYLIPRMVPFGEVFDYPGAGFNITVYYDADQNGTWDGSQTIMVGGGGPLIDFCDGSFDPEDDSLEDAFLRLMHKLNPTNDTNPDGYGSACIDYDGNENNPVDLVIEPDVKIQSQDIGEVPFMWGPVRVRFRVWE